MTEQPSLAERDLILNMMNKEIEGKTGKYMNFLENGVDKVDEVENSPMFFQDDENMNELKSVELDGNTDKNGHIFTFDGLENENVYQNSDLDTPDSYEEEKEGDRNFTKGLVHQFSKKSHFHINKKNQDKNQLSNNELSDDKSLHSDSSGDSNNIPPSQLTNIVETNQSKNFSFRQKIESSKFMKYGKSTKLQVPEEFEVIPEEETMKPSLSNINEEISNKENDSD